MDNKQKLINAHQKMSDLTSPECAHTCRAPHSCCAPEHCDEAQRWARKQWGVDPPVGKHPTLKFMGPTGCTLAPHLRPICTVHTCDIQSLGFKRNDIGGKWTKVYFKLRGQIDVLERKVHANDR